MTPSNQSVNRYCLYDLTYRWNHGTDYAKAYARTVESITAKDIQEMARKITARQNRVLVSMSSTL